MEAARTAIEALASSSKMAGYDTNRDIHIRPLNVRPGQIIGLFGGPGRDRTDDLFHAMEARSQTAPQAHKEGTTLLLSSLAAGKSNPGKTVNRAVRGR